LNSIMPVFQIILIILFSFFSQMKEGAAGSRGVEKAGDVVEERVEEVDERVEEAGPSSEVNMQRATFKGTGEVRPCGIWSSLPVLVSGKSTLCMY